jgi:hypothetical protein
VNRISAEPEFVLEHGNVNAVAKNDSRFPEPAACACSQLLSAHCPATVAAKADMEQVPALVSRSSVVSVTPPFGHAPHFNVARAYVNLAKQPDASATDTTKPNAAVDARNARETARPILHFVMENSSRD